MASQNPPAPPQPDPRLSKPAHYSRDEIISDLQSFYAFLPHIDPSRVHLAPPGGWEEITPESLARHGIHKTDEAVAVLRNVPYIDGREPWIMPLTLVLDYRLVTMEPKERNKPGWMYDAADKQWPPWVLQLTAGTDREGHCYMLDTTDGTVTRYQNGGFEYPPTYAEGDPRNWRDKPCDPETWILKDLLDEWRGQYSDMTVLGVPQPTDPLERCSEPYYYSVHDNPGDENFEATHALRKIYSEHGWPDNYRKEACIQALHTWWRDWVNQQIEKNRLETERYWRERGIQLPQP